MFKKYKSYFILIFVLAVGVIIFNIIIKNRNTDILIEQYLKSYGFNPTEEIDMYSKQISGDNLTDYYKKTTSTSDILYMKLSDKVLREVKLEKEPDIERFFTGIYDFNSGQLTYTYEVSMKDAYLLIKGNYMFESDKVICTFVDSNTVTSSSSLKDISCNKATQLVRKFNDYIKIINKDNKLSERL